MKDKPEGFTDEHGAAISGFECTCKKCGGKNVTFEDDIQMGSDWTGVYGSIDIVCRDCHNRDNVVWA